jgi:hypothetical protein
MIFFTTKSTKIKKKCFVLFVVINNKIGGYEFAGFGLAQYIVRNEILYCSGNSM